MSIESVTEEVRQQARFRAERRLGLGGSDIAAIAGVHPYKTSFDVWLEKTGLAGPEEEESEPSRWGRKLEPIILEEYARREGVELEPPAVMLQDPAHPWMIGHPDAFVKFARVGVDAKMAGLRQAARWGDVETDSVPEEYLAQAQHYLYLSRCERWDVAVLLGQEFRIYRIEPNADLQATLMGIGEHFWTTYVVPKEPPPPNHTDAARRMLERVYPASRTALRMATPEEVELARAYHRADLEAKEVERQRETLRNRLCERIGFADGITDGSSWKITWKRTRDYEVTNWEGAFEALVEYVDKNLVSPRQMDPAAARVTTMRDIELLQRQFTTIRQGSRRFWPTFEEEKA